MDLQTLVFTVPGTLAANHTFTVKMPRPATVLNVSASNSSANAGKVQFGTSADANGFLTDQDVGVSGTPAEYDLNDFDGALLSNPGHEYPRLADGDIFSITITDHASHMANVCVVVTVVDG
jgi:hypothetical protein